MLNEQLKQLCDRYKIKYKIFEETDTIILSTGLDDWLIKYIPGRGRPYCLMHKNRIRQTKKYHVQRYLTKLWHAIDSVINHKKIIVNLYGGSHNTYKRNTK